MVVWIIGLAGAGKTTIGREVHARLKSRNRATVLIDGDTIRSIMGDDLGHSVADRERNGWRVARLCAELERQQIDVVCCILSLFHDQQQWNRDHLTDYFEVFLDVPMPVLEARDQKGLYSGARAGRVHDVVGVDIPFAPPPHADLVIDNAGGSPGDHALDIVRALDAR